MSVKTCRWNARRRSLKCVAAVSRCVSVLFAVATELWVERRNIFLPRSDVQNKQRYEGWSYSPLGPKFHSYHAARESYYSLSFSLSLSLRFKYFFHGVLKGFCGQHQQLCTLFWCNSNRYYCICSIVQQLMIIGQ